MIQAFRLALDLGGVIQEAPVLGPLCIVGPAVTLQITEGGRAAEALVFSLKAVQEGKS